LFCFSVLFGFTSSNKNSAKLLPSVLKKTYVHLTVIFCHTAMEKSSNQEETSHKETKSSATEGGFG
jgi:hypothetical protein